MPPAIELSVMTDNEYVIIAIDRITRKILAAACNYDCNVATLSIDLQLVELGYDIYAAEDYN